MRTHLIAATAALVLPMTLLGACSSEEPAAAPSPTATPSATAPADVQQEVATWADAAALLGTEGSLWEPTKTIGQDLDGMIDVLVQPRFTPVLQVVSATYGTAEKGFDIQEKWADAGWAADPLADIRALPVKTRTIAVGSPDTPAKVTATIVAFCNTEAEQVDATPPADDATCKKTDVKKFGGQLTMTVSPPSTMTAPGDTSVVITTRGLTYKQLIRIAKNLQQVG